MRTATVWFQRGRRYRRSRDAPRAVRLPISHVRRETVNPIGVILEESRVLGGPDAPVRIMFGWFERPMNKDGT